MAELLDDPVELVAGEARPSRDRKTRPLEHLGRLAPGEEVPELVGAQHEQRIVEALGAKQLDRPRIRVEAHLVVWKGRGRERETVIDGRVDHAMSRVLVHENLEPLHVEALSRSVRDCDMAEMRRVERAPVQDRHSHSSSSSPTSTSSPARAPAARRIASSWSSAGGLPVTRKPRSVR